MVKTWRHFNWASSEWQRWPLLHSAPGWLRGRVGGAWVYPWSNNCSFWLPLKQKTLSYLLFFLTRQSLLHPAALTTFHVFFFFFVCVAAVGMLQKQKNIAGALAFWMANASELLNFIKQDRDLNRVTLDAQDILAHLVQMAFKSVCVCGCVSGCGVGVHSVVDILEMYSRQQKSGTLASSLWRSGNMRKLYKWFPPLEYIQMFFKKILFFFCSA